MMFGRKKRRKLFHKEYRDNEVQLFTISRVVYEDGTIEYVNKKETNIPIDKLPLDAVHVTGDKKSFGFVDMEPDYPDYYKDCDGFDAIGYYLYYNDRRMTDAYEAIADFGKAKTQDWKKIIVIVAAGIIFAAVLLKFVM